MRYRISDEITILSENAAKPGSQRSKYLHNYINSLSPVSSSFDMGCGKLRYLESILAVSDRVALVDSEIQLSRMQQLGGRGLSSIREVCLGSNVIAPFNVEEFKDHPEYFDRGFCLNVLPIIPFESERLHVISIARGKLIKGSSCFFVHHYHNKEYRNLKYRESAFEFGDGFILKSLRGYSFFAILKHTYVADLIERCDFEVVSRTLIHGACYFEARAI